MNILIMGGTEFVSRSVAEHFINLNYRVDIFTRGNKNVAYEGYGIHHIGDRKIRDDLKVLSNYQYDYVIDISAYSKEDVSLLLDQVDTSCLKHYIFCSSGAVYIPKDIPMTEKDPIGSNDNWGLYGKNKLEAELYLQEIYQKHKLPISVVRPSYLYGPNNNLYRESYFFDVLLEEKTLPIPDSQHKTQFLHIHDFLLILQDLLGNSRCFGQVFNVTHDKIYDYNQMVDVFEKITSKSAKRLYIDTTKHPVSRKYFPFRDITYTFTNDKLSAYGLHKPKFDLYQGLKQTYKWYLDFKPTLNDPAFSDINTIIKSNR